MLSELKIIHNKLYKSKMIYLIYKQTNNNKISKLYNKKIYKKQ
jgi:hypothetical protein